MYTTALYTPPNLWGASACVTGTIHSEGPSAHLHGEVRGHTADPHILGDRAPLQLLLDLLDVAGGYPPAPVVITVLVLPFFQSILFLLLLTRNTLTSVNLKMFTASHPLPTGATGGCWCIIRRSQSRTLPAAPAGHDQCQATGFSRTQRKWILGPQTPWLALHVLLFLVDV